MTKTFRLFSLFLLCVIAACTQFEEPELEQVQEAEVTTVSAKTRAGSAAVFETLENPYRLLQKLLSSINTVTHNTNI